MLFREFHQNLPVQGDIFFMERADKFTVRHPMFAEGGVQIYEPKAAHGTLFCFAVAEGVSAGFEDSHLGELNFAFSPPHVTFGFAKDIFAVFKMGFTPFYSGHGINNWQLTFDNWQSGVKCQVSNVKII